MEPLAPGTEDRKNFFLTSRKEVEVERLVNIQANLPNGEYGQVFEMSLVNGFEKWYCNLCECPVMGRIYPHETGRRHTQNFAMYNKKGPNTSMQLASIPEPVLQIAPGEPVPPGVECDPNVTKVAQIQERLDAFKVGPLLGVEYLVEMVEDDSSKKPSYQCMLCEKRGDPLTVVAHVSSYNHMQLYIQRHFPTCHRLLYPFFTRQFKRNVQNTVTKIAEAIETKFGRLKPLVVDKDTFDQNRLHHLITIQKGPHFTDQMGDFTYLIIPEEITKVPLESEQPNLAKSTDDKSPKKSPNASRRRSMSSMSDISSDLEHRDGKRKRSRSRDLDRYSRRDSPDRRYSRSRRSSDRDRSRRSPSYRRRRSRSRSPRNGVMPWQRDDYRKSRNSREREKPKSKNDKYEEFKKLAKAIETDLDTQLKEHERNPEKHPQYNEEWKKFWNKRYKELQAEGRDPTSYDFKPEWIQFWNKRMIELHNKELKSKKDALRKRLSLPEEPAPICFRITGKKPPEDRNKSASTSQPDQDVIVIEDLDEDTKSSRRSKSPWDRNSRPRSKTRYSRERSRDRYSRDRERSRIRNSRDRSRAKSSRDRSIERDRGKERSRDLDYYRPNSREAVRDRSPRSRSYSRGHSREGDRPYHSYKDLDIYKPPPVMRDVTRLPVYDKPNIEPEPEVKEDINVVSVLRLLTALEETLGSLGPKVIDLLASALAMEKNAPNTSENLLDNEVNCVLFETVKEKLKGKLQAGLVSLAQEKAVKDAIKSIASLIHFAGVRKKERERNAPKSIDPVKVPGVGTVDKAAIAKQIATALVMQGKTDVSQAELEQLINAVVGMAEASKSAGKPVTTASFLESLTKDSNENASSAPQASNPLKVLQNVTDVDALSDGDLQTLLQNFKDLSADEQQRLITYLKKLEATEPKRVERLRRYVNLGNAEVDLPKNEESRSGSPFTAKLESIKDEFVSKKADEKKSVVQIIDSDEEEYSIEDVFKVAKQNVTEKEQQEKSEEKKKDIDMAHCKAIIANLMGNISKKNQESSVSNVNNAPITQNALDSFQNVSLNISSLASIVDNAKKLGPKPQQSPNSIFSDDTVSPAQNVNPVVGAQGGFMQNNSSSSYNYGVSELQPGPSFNNTAPGPENGPRPLLYDRPGFNSRSNNDVARKNRYDEMDLNGPTEDERRYIGSTFRHVNNQPNYMDNRTRPYMDYNNSAAYNQNYNQNNAMYNTQYPPQYMNNRPMYNDYNRGNMNNHPSNYGRGQWYR